MRRRNWTDEEIQTMKRMYEEGANFSQIAVAIDRDKTLVGKKCREVGIAPYLRRQSPKELWSDEETQKLETLLNAGCTMMQASRALQKSEPSVRGKAVRMGLTPGPGVDRMPNTHSPAIQRAMTKRWVA